ncbi:MAG: cation-translocating P-type ATPase, partial [Clostridia bacterium]|nr:cation-translocating P-type ATPase [Clostridia bacterium]
AIAKKDFFNYNIAMVVASVAALFLSDAKYTEVAFIVLLFEAEITLAKILKDVRTEKIKKRLYYSYDQVRIDGNDDETAFAKDVAVGSLVRFASGETICFDGVVSEGECRADTYNVSVERKTVALVSGDCVRSGWTVTEGEIVLSVKKTAEESFARRLYDKVVGSQESDYSAKTRKFAKFALPVSLAAALVIAFLVPLFLSFGGRTYSESLPVWAYAAVMFFAVCNTFGVVVPLAISRESAVYRALSLNVFPPSQNEFLAVAEADTAVFVEPGALTDTEVDRYKVIAKPAYKGRLIDLLSEYGVSLSAVADGEIVKGNKNGSVLTAGTYAALVNEGISVKELNVKGNVKYVAVDGEVAGAFSFESPLKKNAYGAVRELKDAGVRSVVLTDDAEHLSDLGVEVRPIADENDETVFDKKTTVCVGAPIARAYILIKDTDEYLNAENGAYIPDGDVKSVAKYIKLAKRYKKALKTNAVVSVVAKVVALITGFFLLFAVPFNAMWVAVLIDSLAGTLVTLNAFRCGVEVY